MSRSEIYHRSSPSARGSRSVSTTAIGCIIGLTAISGCQAPAAAAGTFTTRIHVGGAAVVDRAGHTWAADKYLVGGTKASFTTPVSGTSDPSLYSSERWGLRAFAMPVPSNGSYRVRMLFSENYYTKPGERVFSVSSAGRALVPRLDLVALAGANRAYDVTAVVAVTGNVLRIDFGALVGKPKLDGIEVTSVPGQSPSGVTSSTPTPAEPSGPPTTQPPAATRVAADWPFVSTSPWNMPLGSGATFASGSDPRSVNLQQNTPSLAAGSWSHPIYQATDADPMRVVPDTAWQGAPSSSYRIPDGARPAAGDGTSLTDAHMHVVDPTGHIVYENIGMRHLSNGQWTSGYAVTNSLFGPGVGTGGTRAYGGSAIGGLIRTKEVKAGVIPHALAMALEHYQLRRGFVWPATDEDHDSASTYSGSIPMGSLVAIPSTVDLASAGLTPSGLAMARALQNYGGYIVDHCANVCFYAEPTAESLPQLADMRADLDTIRSMLRVVTNNSAANVGGGGTRRAPLAPPLIP